MINPGSSSENALPEAAGASVFWRWLAALAILVNIGVSYYSNARPFNGQTMGELSAKYYTPLTPAGYAFSIWGLIFLSLAVYAAWQLLPAQRRNPLPDAVAKSLALANLAAAAWVVLFSYEKILASVGVMFIILIALMLTYGTARGMLRTTNVAPRWVSIPFALFLGWITVATFINVTIGLQVLGWQVAPGAAITLTYILLVLIVLLTLVLARVFQERTLPLVIGWALVGIWVAHVSQNPTLAWTMLASAVLVVLVGLVLAQQGRKLQPWEVSSAAAAEAQAHHGTHHAIL
jgi:hypothetical protein